MKNHNFLKNHADTIAIIGVNVALVAIMLSVCLNNMANISASNARLDATNARIDNTYNMFYDLLKELNK